MQFTDYMIDIQIIFFNNWRLIYDNEILITLYSRSETILLEVSIYKY